MRALVVFDEECESALRGLVMGPILEGYEKNRTALDRLHSL